MPQRSILAVLLCATLASASACSSAPAGSVDGGPSGLINGHPFAKHGQSVIGDKDDNENQVGWVLELWNEWNGCVTAIRPPANATVLRFHLPLKPQGTYDARGAVDFYVSFDVGTQINVAPPRSGTVTVTAFSMEPGNRYIAGTYDITFEGGDHLADSFMAQFC